MTNSWDDMRRAKEESYFDRKNREALERLAAKKETAPRLSPITGEPMEQVVVHGVVVDRCPKSGGIWLDQGELEALLRVGTEADQETRESLLGAFVKSTIGEPIK